MNWLKIYNFQYRPVNAFTERYRPYENFNLRMPNFPIKPLKAAIYYCYFISFDVFLSKNIK